MPKNSYSIERIRSLPGKLINTKATKGICSANLGLGDDLGLFQIDVPV